MRPSLAFLNPAAGLTRGVVAELRPTRGNPPRRPAPRSRSPTPRAEVFYWDSSSRRRSPERAWIAVVRRLQHRTHKESYRRRREMTPEDPSLAISLRPTATRCLVFGAERRRERPSARHATCDMPTHDATLEGTGRVPVAGAECADAAEVAAPRRRPEVSQAGSCRPVRPRRPPALHGLRPEEIDIGPRFTRASPENWGSYSHPVTACGFVTPGRTVAAVPRWSIDAPRGKRRKSGGTAVVGCECCLRWGSWPGSYPLRMLSASASIGPHPCPWVFTGRLQPASSVGRSF